jgi:hypothetical protein
MRQNWTIAGGAVDCFFLLVPVASPSPLLLLRGVVIASLLSTFKLNSKRSCLRLGAGSGDVSVFFVGIVSLKNGQRHTTSLIQNHTTTLSHEHCTTVYCEAKVTLYLSFIDEEVALRVETAAAAVVWASLMTTHFKK